MAYGTMHSAALYKCHTKACCGQSSQASLADHSGVQVFDHATAVVLSWTPQKEKKDEKRQRGNPETYTTDARFDASFQLGHGLTGPKPWYARTADPTVQQQWEQIAQHQPIKQLKQPPQQQQHMLALPATVPALGPDYGSRKQRSKRRRSSRSSSGSDSDSSDSNSCEGRSRKRAKHKLGSTSRRRSSSSSKKRKHKKTHKKDKVGVPFAMMAPYNLDHCTSTTSWMHLDCNRMTGNLLQLCAIADSLEAAQVHCVSQQN